VGDLSVGVTLGKYAPLHRGHQLVIECAIREMDRVIVVVYGAPSTTSVPLSVRAGWIREIYPGVEVIEAPGGPEETGYTPAVMETQERFLTELLSGRRITAFYSSEPYGEHVSRALGCRDRQVDPGRREVTVSAREIRANIPEHAHLLHPAVRADVVPRLALLGGPSTGKTTLAHELAADLGERACEEYGREYWFAHQRDHRLSMEDLEIIAAEQMLREEAAARAANRYVVADTSPLTTLVYAKYYHGTASPELERLVRSYHERPRALLLCDTDIPFDDTWDRSGPGSRKRLQELTIAELSARGLEYTVVSGSRDTRRAAARRVADTLRGQA
jgi:NadR type nicotinamide-nucleotide adenylyltransferase